MLRCQYIIKVVYTSLLGQTFTDSIENYGWKLINEKIQIVWENEELMSKHCTSKGCGCKGGCDGSKAGCKNCYRMCKPCTPKCKCKMNCNNPHNNGGTCDRCKVVSTATTATNNELFNIDNDDNNENDNSDNNDKDSDNDHDEEGDSECEEESNETTEQDDAMLPTQLITSNDRVDTESETDSDSEHEEDDIP